MLSLLIFGSGSTEYLILWLSGTQYSICVLFWKVPNQHFFFLKVTKRLLGELKLLKQMLPANRNKGQGVIYNLSPGLIWPENICFTVLERDKYNRSGGPSDTDMFTWTMISLLLWKNIVILFRCGGISVISFLCKPFLDYGGKPW